jgi:hypothetical protein
VVCPLIDLGVIVRSKRGGGGLLDRASRSLPLPLYLYEWIAASPSLYINFY